MAREPEELASIDELLGVGDEPDADPVDVPPRPTSGVWSWLGRTVLLSALGTGAVQVVLLQLGYKIPYSLLFFGFFALISVRRALRAVDAPTLAVGAVPAAPAIGGVDPDALSDGIRLAVGRWDSRLSWTERDPARFESVVRPRLAEIADERLRQRHGVTRASDPNRAQEIMGDRLWTFLFAPLARTPNPRELAAVVDDMEKL